MRLTGKVINERYKVTEKIDEGGMAIVYKSTDLLLVRAVAIKVLKDRFARNKNVLERFYREARAAAGLSHTNIVSIYDIGREDDFYFIVMEYMGSGTLEELMENKKVLAPQEVVKFGIQICQALEYSHQKGVIHRDIKPQNIMLTEENQVKVVDFGIARAVDAREITEKGLIMGSAYYFSPEQASGKTVTERSDIYSLGVLLYYMATGQHPFEGSSFSELVRKHMRERPKNPSTFNSKIPLELEKIILRAMEKKAGDRFASAEDMLNALRASLSLFDDLYFEDEYREEEAIDYFETEEDDDSPFFSEEYERQLQEDYEKGKSGDEEIVITLDDLKDSYKSKKKFSFLPFAIILAALVFIGLIVGVFIAINSKPQEVPMIMVPNIKGRKEVQAVKILEQWGLFLGDIKEEHNYDYPKGTIISQFPDEGETVKRGAKISVILSLGPRKVVVPGLINKSLKEAQLILIQKGLILEILREEYHEDLDPGCVISQEPPAGTEVEGKSIVHIVISKGRDGIIVPDLTGLSEGEGKSIISLQGLNFVVSGEEVSDLEKGSIISQEPSSGEVVARGASIRVVLSAGKEDEIIIVPALTAISLEEAKKLLEELGLKINIKSDEGKIKDDMVVYEQDPSEGAKLIKGDEVLIKIKSKVTIVEVPDIKGKLLMDAKNALRRKGLEVGELTEIMTNDFPSDTVIDQDPLPKTLLATGTSVSLTIAKPVNKDMVNVPDLLGMDLEGAEKKLESLNLTLGGVIGQPSGEKSGIILSQAPVSGTLVKKETAISLIISQ